MTLADKLNLASWIVFAIAGYLLLCVWISKSGRNGE